MINLIFVVLARPLTIAKLLNAVTANKKGLRLTVIQIAVIQIDVIIKDIINVQ